MRTLPLITDLQSPAMRPRHWEELSKVVGSPLDPHSAAFTLDTLVSFHLDQHAALIGSMSADAGRQVAIEQTLQVGPSYGPCVRSTRSDNSVVGGLGKMRASHMTSLCFLL